MPASSSDRAALGVTTSRGITAARRAYARARAERWGATYVEREELTLEEVLDGFDAILVFERARVRLVDRLSDLAFHPGMAYRRIQRLSGGGTDPLIDAGRIARGQRVLDATLGLGQDALVAAAAVGRTGAVTGLEASRVLAAFVGEGLPTCALPPGTDPDIADVIRVHHTEAIEWLTGTDERFDVALLDPMFSRPKPAEPSFGVLRRYALPTPLSDDLVAAALARATTVVAKLADSSALTSLSTAPDSVRRSAAAVYVTFTGPRARKPAV
ncbi:MAG TPA: class I SAM-dependent methyltransferase [Actinopolymorphaceae bacterium]